MASLRKRKLHKESNKFKKKSKLQNISSIGVVQQHIIEDEEDVQSSYQILVNSLPSKSKYKYQPTPLQDTAKQPPNSGLVESQHVIVGDRDDPDDDSSLPSCEPFSTHFDNVLDDKQIDTITSLYSQPLELQSVKNDLGLIQWLTTPISCTYWMDPCISDKPHPLESLHIRQPMATSIQGCLSSKQYQLFNIMNTYKDVIYTNRTNEISVSKAYVLHVLNHVIKSRSRVLKNNAKLSHDSDNDECRDQGIARPKVLILLPFRSCAVQIVETMSTVMFASGKGEVSNKKRFTDEYSSKADDPPPNYKPKSYSDLFDGNTDDCFKVGISIKKNSINLYKKFYASDIIMASPLGLRMIIGGEGDKERDFDYLSSLEIIIVDQMDVFLMQNWDHLLHVFEHVHIQPKDGHGVNFSRVREWALNGNNRFYCQHLFISSFLTPEINSLMMKYFCNYEGQVRISLPLWEGSVRHVVRSIPQIFYRFKSPSCKDIADNRFSFFVDVVLPKLLGSHMDQTCVYIPSYFDFVRVRNHFKKEEIEFTMMSEYTKLSSVSRARSFFSNGRKRLLLMTERLHFFRRYRVNKIRHLVFYGLPTYNEFYAELINMMNAQCPDITVLTIYCEYDVLALQRIVGSRNASVLLKSDDFKQTVVTGRE